MSNYSQEEKEALLSLIRKSYRELGAILDILDESILQEHSMVSTRPAEKETVKLLKILDTLGEIT